MDQPWNELHWLNLMALLHIPKSISIPLHLKELLKVSLDKKLFEYDGTFTVISVFSKRSWLPTHTLWLTSNP